MTDNVSTSTTPTIDTSEYDAVSTYEPSLPEGLTTVTGLILDFGPAVKRDDGSYQGWSLTFALTEEVADDSGGKLPVGKRMGPYTIFTTESQYRNTAQCAKDAVINLQGLNGIVRDKAADPKFSKADGAFHQLPAEKKLPLRVDMEPAHYEQWKNTICKFLLKRKGDNINLLQILAASTPVGARGK